VTSHSIPLPQDLLSVTLEIPFSVPPYMSLLARSVATLEGIALAGDPEYQMVAQVRPEDGLVSVDTSDEVSVDTSD
jgi:predicted unusual protein kinase regulating ubiquinone biosynthesis (AarF/ABC1/UbiB family)